MRSDQDPVRRRGVEPLDDVVEVSRPDLATPGRDPLLSHPSLLSQLIVWPQVTHEDPSVPQVPCFTCGELPVGVYHDGSPRYDHGHDLVTGETWRHPRPQRASPGGERVCPSCHHRHPVGTTCLQCPSCVVPDSEESEQSEETDADLDDRDDAAIDRPLLVTA